MIKLVENEKEALLVLSHLKCDTAPLLAACMFTEGFGTNQDFLQIYAAFNESGKLCASFVKCNDRIFCLIDSLYDKDEIVLFLNGFSDFKIFISTEYANIINREKLTRCTLMKKIPGLIRVPNTLAVNIDSKDFTNIIMQGKTKEALIRFLLNNSHLQRHGYINNYAIIEEEEVFSIASLYENKSHCYLCNVFTPPHHRNKGWAYKLINDITDIDKECHLICSEEISPLYLKCGFIPYAKWIEFLY